MEQGLGDMMVYGDGKGNTVTSYYAGTMKKKKKEGDSVACKRKKGK
jgi:hypothetical protein